MKQSSEKELLALLEEHLPEELSTVQIDQLRRGMQEFPAVRQAILESLGFEQVLAASGAPKPPDREELLRQCQAHRVRRRREKWSALLWSVLAVALICSLLVSVVLVLPHFAPEGKPSSQQVAKQQAASAVSNSGTQVDDRPEDTIRNADTENRTEEPEGGTSTDRPDGNTTALPEEPLALEISNDPPWRLFDDRVARGDMTWRDRVHEVLLPLDGASAMSLENENFWLDGQYVAKVPNPEGRRLRLSLHGTKETEWFFGYHDRPVGVLVRWDKSNYVLQCFAAHQKEGSPRFPQFEQALQSDAEGPSFDSLRSEPIEKVDHSLNYRWKDRDLPESTKQSNRIWAVWRGLINFPDRGNWQLAVTTKGAISIRVDQKSVHLKKPSDLAELSLSKTISNRPEEQTVANVMEPTALPIEIEYCGDPKDDGIRIEWERSLTYSDDPQRRREAIARSAIPPEAFIVEGNKDRPGQKGLPVRINAPSSDDPLESIEIDHLLATDQGVWARRFEQGTIDVAYSDGALRFLRGDVPLFSAKVDPPDLSLMHLQAELRNAETFQVQPAEPYGDLTDCVVAESEMSLKTDQWKTDRYEHETKLAIEEVEGGLEFSRLADDQSPLHAYLPLDHPRGAELIARIDHATPGMGIVMKNEIGHDLRLMVGVYEGKRVLYTNVQEESHLSYCHNQGWIVGETFWIRCEAALSHAAMSFSNDGVNWIMIHRHHHPSSGTLEKGFRIAVRAEDGKGERVLRLGRLTMQQFQGLEALADPALLAKAEKKLDETEAWEENFEAVLDASPEGVASKQWALACHLAALPRWDRWSQRLDAVRPLFEAAVAAEVPMDRLYSALLELPRRLAGGDTYHRHRELSRLYLTIACKLWDARPSKNPKGASRADIHRLLDAWQLQRWGMHAGEHSSTPEELAKTSLIALAIEEDWEKLWKYALREDSFSTTGRYRNAWITTRVALAIWLQHKAIGHLQPKNPVEAQLLKNWREERFRTSSRDHPLTMKKHSREMDSILGEVRMAIESKAWDQAAMTLLRLPLRDELLQRSAASETSATADGLLTSSRLAIRNLLKQYPPLVEAMNRQERVGRLRLTRGRKYCESLTGDEGMRLIESVATLFANSEVGREAQRVLADYDLSRGEFLQAAARYRALIESLAETDDSPKEELTAKYRLASAMSGHDVGTSAKKPITLGGKTYQADRFEQILREMIERNKKQDIATSQIAGSCVPVHTTWKTAHLLMLEKTEIRGFEPRLYSYINTFHLENLFDPTNVGLAVGDGNLYLHQQGRWLEIDPVIGKKLREVSEPIKKGGQGEPHNASNKPLIHGDHLIVPFYWASRSELMCFDRNTGNVVWRHPYDDMVLAAAPGNAGSLLTLTIRLQEGEYGDLILRRIDPSSGRSVLAKKVARVHLRNDSYHVGQIVLHEDRILFRVGCALICCDLMANPLWVAPLPYLPRKTRHYAIQELSPSELVIVGDRVLATAVGSMCIECRDIETGRLLWRFQQPNLEYVIGRSGNSLVFALNGMLCALDIATGEPVWSRSIDELARTVLLDSEGNLLLLGTVHTEEEQSTIVRLCGSTGETLSPLTFEGDPNALGLPRRVFTDGKRLYRIGYVTDRKERIALQILESED